MTRKEDTVDFGPHWHLDCRLVKELPEDNVVRVRFLADALAGAVALGLVVFAATLFYGNNSTASDIHSLEQRLAQNKPAINELRALQARTTEFASRIDSAYRISHQPYLVTRLWLAFGRTRPEAMRIGIIEANEGMIILRGSLAESSEKASRLLGRYVENLRRDPEIGPHFKSISLTSLDRPDDKGARLSFEITMRQP